MAPSQCSDAWRHVGEVIDDSDQVRAVGLRTVAFHLSRASEGDDCEALAGFREADKTRRQLGCSWPNLINGRGHPNRLSSRR